MKKNYLVKEKEYLWGECVNIEVIFCDCTDAADFMIGTSTGDIFEFYAIYNSICAGYNNRPRSNDQRDR